MNRRSFLKLLAAVPFVGLAAKSAVAKAAVVRYNLPGGRSRWYDQLWGEPKPPGTFCPVCGSEDVDIDNGDLRCNKCGAEGTIIVQLETYYKSMYPDEYVEALLKEPEVKWIPKTKVF